MGDLNVYESTRDGVSRQSATPGSAADRRFSKSGRWRLVRGAAPTGQPEPGEPDTFDELRDPPPFMGEEPGTEAPSSEFDEPPTNEE